MADQQQQKKNDQTIRLMKKLGNNETPPVHTEEEKTKMQEAQESINKALHLNEEEDPNAEPSSLDKVKSYSKAALNKVKESFGGSTLGERINQGLQSQQRK